MKKFNKCIFGYSIGEVDRYIDSILYDNNELKRELLYKNNRINELDELIKLYELKYDNINTEESIAKNERDAIISEARKNANRIVSDALDRARKIEKQSEVVRKNIAKYKDNTRLILNKQLDLVDDLDIDLLD